MVSYMGSIFYYYPLWYHEISYYLPCNVILTNSLFPSLWKFLTRLYTNLSVSTFSCFMILVSLLLFSFIWYAPLILPIMIFWVLPFPCMLYCSMDSSSLLKLYTSLSFLFIYNIPLILPKVLVFESCFHENTLLEGLCHMLESLVFITLLPKSDNYVQDRDQCLPC